MDAPSPITIKMQAARLMIEEKRYETARELLKGLTNRQALDWMLKIDTIASRKRRGVKWSWSWALVTILVLVCVILILTLAIRERENNMRVWQAQRFDANLALVSYCLNGEFGQGDLCNTWATNVLNTDISLSDKIVKCVNWERLSELTNINEQFRACMGAIGIPNPNF